MLLWASLTLWHMSTMCSPFPSQLIMSNFPSVLIVYHWFLTWIALCDVDLRFSLMLVIKANVVEKETGWAKWFYDQHNQFIHMTDGMTVTSLSASLLQKISAAKDFVCQIVLNWILLCKYKKSDINFQVTLKWNRAKWNRIKQDPPVFSILWLEVCGSGLIV